MIYFVIVVLVCVFIGYFGYVFYSSGVRHRRRVEAVLRRGDIPVGVRDEIVSLLNRHWEERVEYYVREWPVDELLVRQRRELGKFGEYGEF